MGQKKTWALHHVPYSMLWDTMALDYSHQWLPVLQSHLSSGYSSAIVDYYFKKSLFTFVWGSHYTTREAATHRSGARVAGTNWWAQLHSTTAPVFEWTVNSNKGTNETMIAKAYLIKMQNSTTLLNLFFRADFFEQKSKIQSTSSARRALPTAAIAEPVRQEIFKRIKRQWPSIRLGTRRASRLVAHKTVVGRSLNYSFKQKKSHLKNLAYSAQLNTQLVVKLLKRKAKATLKKFKVASNPLVKRSAGSLSAQTLPAGFLKKLAKPALRHPSRPPLNAV